MLKKAKIKAKSLKTKVCKRRVRFISLKFRPLQLRYPNQNQQPERLACIGGFPKRETNLIWRCLSPLFGGDSSEQTLSDAGARANKQHPLRQLQLQASWLTRPAKLGISAQIALKGEEILP